MWQLVLTLVFFQSSVTAYLVLSIISMCLCVPMFIIAIVGEIAAQVDLYTYWDDSYNPYEDTQCKPKIYFTLVSDLRKKLK